MPSLRTASCFISLPEANASLTSRHCTSILRLTSASLRISIIASSWKSASAVRLTVVLFLELEAAFAFQVITTIEFLDGVLDRVGDFVFVQFGYHVERRHVISPKLKAH